MISKGSETPTTHLLQLTGGVEFSCSCADETAQRGEGIRAEKKNWNEKRGQSLSIKKLLSLNILKNDIFEHLENDTFEYLENVIFEHLEKCYHWTSRKCYLWTSRKC